jgi:hypothetical protein
MNSLSEYLVEVQNFRPDLHIEKKISNIIQGISKEKFPEFATFIEHEYFELCELPKAKALGFLSQNISCKEAREIAIETVKKACPKGWTPDLGFNSQNSFYTDEKGNTMARTTIRRWVKKGKEDVDNS